MSPVLPSRRLLVLAALASLLAALPARAQDEVEYPAGSAGQCRAIWHEYGRWSWDGARAAWCEVRELGALPARATVAADAGEGNGLRVRGGPQSVTRVRLVIQALGATPEAARALAQGVSLDLSADTLRVTGTGQRSGGRVSATIVFLTPRHADLALSAHNGPLDVEGVQGRMSLEVVNGPLTISGLGGDVRARAQNGPIDIELTGDRWEGTGLDAEAQNGPVSLALPRNYSAELDAGTQNGPFSVDYPMTVNRISRRHLTTTLGKGGARVRAVTQNGPMSIEQGG